LSQDASAETRTRSIFSHKATEPRRACSGRRKRFVRTEKQTRSDLPSEATSDTRATSVKRTQVARLVPKTRWLKAEPDPFSHAKPQSHEEHLAEGVSVSSEPRWRGLSQDAFLISTGQQANRMSGDGRAATDLADSFVGCRLDAHRAGWQAQRFR
jgi:hypothetical protein